MLHLFVVVWIWIDFPSRDSDKWKKTIKTLFDMKLEEQ